MNESTWDGIERRRNEAPRPGDNGGTSDAAFLGYIVSQLDALNHKMDAMHNDHIRQAAAIAGLESAIPKTPDGTPDYDGHYDDHAIRTGIIKALRKMAGNALDKIFSGALISILLFIVYAIWEAIRSEVKN